MPGLSWSPRGNWSWQEGTGEVGSASQSRLELGCLPAADDALHATSPSRVSALGRKCPLCFAPSHSTWHVSVPCSQCKACPPLPVHVLGGPGTPKLHGISVQCWLPGQGRLGASHNGQFQVLSPAVDPEPGNSLSEAAVSALPGECAWMKSEPAAGAGQDFPVDPVLCPVCCAGS